MVWLVGWLGFVWQRWQNLGFATFDLAFYLQSLWGFCHGQWNVTLLGVPMLGNHADWIVMLLTPLYALVPYAMIPVIAQITLLSLMAPLGMRIAEGLGFGAREAAALGLALLVTPATAFVATHEFHPEALTSLFLLCLYYGEQRRSKLVFWLNLVGLLACKENMALLLPFWFAVRGWQRWQAGEGIRELALWYAPALVLGIGYFLLYQVVLQPIWNTGKVDYWNLYSDLGQSPSQALGNLLAHPDIWFRAAWRGATHGTLVWGLLAPMLLLPLLRPGWLIIAAPLLAQHLLSWRASEWMISNHYPAPLIPIFWLASVEALAWLRLKWPGKPVGHAAWGMLAACAALTFVIGVPTRAMTDALVVPDHQGRLEAATRRDLIRRIQPADSVFAPLPYQSHLANRRELYSSHLLLKGLNTLSNSRWEPPASTDVVIMDYADLATFNVPSGYYHARLFGKDGSFVPSSDELFAQWMQRQTWEVYQVNELALWRRRGPDSEIIDGPQAELGAVGRYRLIDKAFPDKIGPNIPSRANLLWSITPPPEGVKGDLTIPWADLLLFPANQPPGAAPPFKIIKGWCLPEERLNRVQDEDWYLLAPSNILPGKYHAVLDVYDRRAREFPGILRDPKAMAAQGVSAASFQVDLGEMELLGD